LTKVPTFKKHKDVRHCDRSINGRTKSMEKRSSFCNYFDFFFCI